MVSASGTSPSREVESSVWAAMPVNPGRPTLGQHRQGREQRHAQKTVENFHKSTELHGLRNGGWSSLTALSPYSDSMPLAPEVLPRAACVETLGRRPFDHQYGPRKSQENCPAGKWRTFKKEFTPNGRRPDLEQLKASHSATESPRENEYGF